MNSNSTKIVGLIGGMSVHSSIKMEQMIHGIVNQVLGGLSCAELLTRTVNFEPVHQQMLNGEWSALGEQMSTIASSLVRAGATHVAIATNTMHRIAPQVIEKIGGDRFIHIGDCTAARCRQLGVRRILFLGTKESMTSSFMLQRLEDRGLTVYVPGDAVDKIDEIIFERLCHNVVDPKDFEFLAGHVFPEYIEEWGIEGIVLGCTELSMLINERNCSRRLGSQFSSPCGFFPFIDSTTEHVALLRKPVLVSSHSCLILRLIPRSRSSKSRVARARKYVSEKRPRPPLSCTQTLQRIVPRNI